MAQPSATPGSPEFSGLRRLFWPVHGFELKKFLPMFLMFFFISLVYSLLRNTKDSFIVTAPGGGADLIPFLKVYGVIPISVIYLLVFSKLSNRLEKPRLFTVALLPFLVFFGLFALVFPVRDSIQPVAAMAWLQGQLPPWLATLAALGRHWLLSLFYVMAELWGSVALSLLFWGFANDVVRVEESKRFYALFGLGANLALVAVQGANQLIHSLEGILLSRSAMTPWTAYVTVLMAVVMLCILTILGIYHWIQRRVLSDPRFYPNQERQAVLQAKPKMAMGEAFRFLARSRYLLCIGIMVIGYGIAINLIEVTWKTHLGLRYPDPKDYQDYMAGFSLATGITTIILMLGVTNNVIRLRGWSAAALITPAVLAGTGVLFFSFILFQDRLGPLLERFGTTPLGMAVLVGFIQNVMSKASKYSLFDPTKEMAYIPLDQESKVKGKAAIDVVGARLGKAGGSIIQQVLIAISHSLRAVPGQIAGILLLVIAAWIWATVTLGKAFQSLTRKNP